MRRLWVVALLTLLAGCASWPFDRLSTVMLAKADRLAEQGDYPGAVAAYDNFLAEHADSSKAARARLSRDRLASVLAAREELARLHQELARLREELAKREGDLTRVRQEADRLRTDLERLKQMDLRLERRTR